MSPELARPRFPTSSHPIPVNHQAHEEDPLPERRRMEAVAGPMAQTAVFSAESFPIHQFVESEGRDTGVQVEGPQAAKGTTRQKIRDCIENDSESQNWNTPKSNAGVKLTTGHSKPMA